MDSVVNHTHILQLAEAHDCIGYRWLSVNDNLCLRDGVEKVVGWSPIMLNRLCPDLYPSYYRPCPDLYPSYYQNLARNIDSLLVLCKVSLNTMNSPKIMIFKTPFVCG